jgi:hypothetical protein
MPTPIGAVVAGSGMAAAIVIATAKAPLHPETSPL